MSRNKFLEDVGRAFIPSKFREKLRLYMMKAGYETVPYSFFGILFFVMVLLTLIIHFIFLLPIISGFGVIGQVTVVLALWIFGLGGLIVLTMFFIWSYLNIKIYNRTKEMEFKLPDYLSLVVTNLKSGMSFDKSLWSAIRPEFGVLSQEIGMVSKRVMTGNDTTDALGEFAMRYDSPILRRSINLIVSEIESGGEIATVIERVIDNLRKTRQLKQEMAASVVSYMIFISVIVLFLAPMLFALSNMILKVIINFAGQIASTPSGGLSGSGGSMFTSLSKLADNGDSLMKNFKLFCYMALGVISLFAGVIVSIIEKGDIRGGIKYIPIFVTISLVVFAISLKLLDNLFSGFIGI